MKLLNEPFFEPLARLARFIFGSFYVPHFKPLVIVDLGCGPKIRFFHFARRTGIQLKKYIGFDSLLDKDILLRFKKIPSVVLKGKNIVKVIDLPSNSVDCVVAFAYLEHIENPQEILQEMIRIVRPGGIVVITTPSDKAKPFLEFFSYYLGLISRREIEEHKRYFTKETLLDLVPRKILSQVTITHHYFELYLNNLLIIKKNEA